MILANREQHRGFELAIKGEKSNQVHQSDTFDTPIQRQLILI